METVTFYFSFRSPYAWLAFHRIDRALEGLPVGLRRVPVFPPASFPSDPAANAAKARYIGADVARMAAALGFPLRWPRSVDTDWMRPHAAWLAADDRGRGVELGRALFAARFSEGKDVGDDETLREAVIAAGLDPATIVAAAGDHELQARVSAGREQAFAAGVFGVPFFAYRTQTFWGNDRIEWLLRTILADLGQAQPDLGREPLAAPFRRAG